MTKTTSFTLGRGVTLMVFSLLGSHAFAAEQLIVSTDQMKAMGIQTAPVVNNSGDLKNRYPAQVIVPPGAEQVVASPMQAMVSQLLVSEFQNVTKGQPVVRLAGPAMSQLQLELLQASSRAGLARKAYGREKTLFDEGIIPQRRAQEAEAALREAEATLSQVRSELSLAGLSKADIDKVIKSGSPSDAIVLTASQDGIVTTISAKPGQRVDAATALLNIAQIKTLWIDIQVTSFATKNLVSGTMVNVVGKEITGTIKSISPVIAPGNQFVIMRAEVENVKGELRPGEYISVDIPVSSVGNAWDLPLSAVARNKDDSVVFVKTEQGFAVRPVEVVASTGQFVRIEGDIQSLDQVAVSGVVALKGAWLAEGETE